MQCYPSDSYTHSQKELQTRLPSTETPNERPNQIGSPVRPKILALPAPPSADPTGQQGQGPSQLAQTNQGFARQGATGNEGRGWHRPPLPYRTRCGFCGKTDHPFYECPTGINPRACFTCWRIGCYKGSATCTGAPPIKANR